MTHAGDARPHLSARHLSVRAQVIVHAVVLGAAGLVLPLDIAPMGAPPPTASPVPWLLNALGRTPQARHFSRYQRPLPSF